MHKGYPEELSEIEVIQRIRLELKRYKSKIHENNRTAQNYVRDVSILLECLDSLGNPEYADVESEQQGSCVGESGPS